MHYIEKMSLHMSSEQLKLYHETTSWSTPWQLWLANKHEHTHTRWRTSSNWRLCSFCSSMRFCLSASSWCLCPSFCCCSSCCLRRASDRSLLASCSRRKSRLRVDSPGTLMMELYRDGWMNESSLSHIPTSTHPEQPPTPHAGCTWVLPCHAPPPPLHSRCIRTLSHLQEWKCHNNISDMQNPPWWDPCQVPWHSVSLKHRSAFKVPIFWFCSFFLKCTYDVQGF